MHNMYTFERLIILYYERSNLIRRNPYKNLCFLFLGYSANFRENRFCKDVFVTFVKKNVSNLWFKTDLITFKH